MDDHRKVGFPGKFHLPSEPVTLCVLHLRLFIPIIIQSVTNDVQKISKQIKSIQNTVGDTLSVVTGDEEYMEDISSAASAKDTDGVVSGSVNRGIVNGDLNVGGIVGTMNIEYDLDPEFDPDLTDSTDITLRSTVNNVVIRCSNYGEVTSKKNSVGGITGLEELGLVYGSESYGSVKSDTGDYAGGIAGNSVSAIANPARTLISLL
jgi:hypothetical protein